MQLRIEATDFPGRSCGPGPDRPDGHRNINVGVQRRGRPAAILDLTPGDAEAAAWVLDCTVAAAAGGPDLTGAYIQGPPGGRFIYLSWVTLDDDAVPTMFRRAKLWLNAIGPEIIEAASSKGALVGRLGLSGEDGRPVCASVRPPLIEWSAAAPAQAPPR
jgi:hypothetical protein